MPKKAGDSNTNCNWCTWNNPQRIGKGAGRMRSQRTSGDHPPYMSKIGQNTEKSPGNCSFEPEIIKIGQSSHKMYSNNILSFQESTTILNAHTKKSLETYRMHLVGLVWFGLFVFYGILLVI